MKKLIKVEVGAGLFSTERTVSFGANGSRLSLLVDARQIEDEDKISVRVVDEVDGDVFVDLPNETFSAGSRVRIPKSLLI